MYLCLLKYFYTRTKDSLAGGQLKSVSVLANSPAAQFATAGHLGKNP